MSVLVFDIETVGESWGNFDNTTKKVLTRWIDRVARNDEEKEVLIKDLKERLGFSPLTGFIVALGVYDVEKEKGTVYYVGAGDKKEEKLENGFLLKERTEKELLEEFWQGAEYYDTFVSFNGRVFDAPFLFLRSAVYDLKPTKNLLEGRYPYQQRSCRHVDLQDELTFFGAVARKPSLHLFCRAFGIDSPKEEGGGDEVAELFASKKFRDLAIYNAGDIIATTKLYQKWKNNLSFYQTEIEENIDF